MRERDDEASFGGNGFENGLVVPPHVLLGLCGVIRRGRASCLATNASPHHEGYTIRVGRPGLSDGVAGDGASEDREMGSTLARTSLFPSPGMRFCFCSW